MVFLVYLGLVLLGQLVICEQVHRAGLCRLQVTHPLVQQRPLVSYYSPVQQLVVQGAAALEDQVVLGALEVEELPQDPLQGPLGQLLPRQPFPARPQ